jgi:hypothetical protein
MNGWGRHAPWFAVWAISIVVESVAFADDVRDRPVGMLGRIDQVVLPGSELEVKPLQDPRAPIVLRVAAVFPHGDAYRYDLVYYGLEAGTFDLRDYLRRKDGSPVADLSPLTVAIRSSLPPGQILPHKLEAFPPTWFGSYRMAMLAGGIAWLLGLVAILIVGRRRSAAAMPNVDAPVNLADRLRPLVEQGLAGTLTRCQRAELERTLLAFWRRRLHLEDQKPAEAMSHLRAHPDAGQLLNHLDTWLHKPGTTAGVDLERLLRPYQNVAANSEEPISRGVEKPA